MQKRHATIGGTCHSFGDVYIQNRERARVTATASWKLILKTLSAVIVILQWLSNMFVHSCAVLKSMSLLLSLCAEWCRAGFGILFVHEEATSSCTPTQGDRSTAHGNTGKEAQTLLGNESNKGSRKGSSRPCVLGRALYGPIPVKTETFREL